MVFTTSGSINIYDGFDFKYIHRRPENIFPLDGYHGFYRIYPQSDSLLWIKDHRKLMCIDLYAEKYIDPQTNPALSSFGIEAINDLFVDEKNNLWTLHKDTILYKNGSAVLDISSNNGILQDLFADEDCLYLFYNNGAIVCYDLQTGEQLYSKTAYGSEDVNKFRNTSLVVAGSKGFYQLRNGYMGGFFFFDKKKRSWQTILETGYSLNTLIVCDDRYISISCFKGLWEIDLDEGTKKYYPELKTVEGGNVSTEISTLFRDVQGA